MRCWRASRASRRFASRCTSRTRRSPRPSRMSASSSCARAMAEAFLALGGNVGDARATLARAIELLGQDGTVRLVARSSDYRTPPWGDEDQPAFINACILVTTTLAPRALLERAHAVE